MRTNKVLKATIWYTLSSFILKGIGFLTTPVFSRILSIEEYGIVNNFNAWLAIVTVIGSLCLSASLIRARFDYENELNSYVKTNLFLGSSVTLLLTVLLLSNSFWSELFVLDKKCIVIMCITTLVHPAYDMFIQIEQFRYKYKIVALLSIVLAVSNVLFSFLFIWILEDNALARIIGGQIPSIVIAVILYGHFIRKGGGGKLQYIKYSIPMCIPFIFHMLSATILNSSDRTMITKICSANDTAYYSMAYNVAFIVSAIWTAMNTAFSPWLGERLNNKDYEEIKKHSKPYVSIFVLISICFMLFAPEILYVLGGEKYIGAKYVIPPVIQGCIFVFLYSLYVNIEQYEKKTLGMAICTALTAATNVLLNSIFIPQYGYIAAAYTTMCCYFILLILHYILVFRLRMHHCYSTKFIIMMVVVSGVFSVLSLLLYEFTNARIIVLVILGGSSMFFLYKNKERLMGVLRSRS
ncbi:MAG: oligosaccharide flippase family protein [Salinivirgaceae bacterium]|nr:oligosaccharide flippase family protein [Salinivirgaceae bacterium]